MDAQYILTNETQWKLCQEESSIVLSASINYMEWYHASNLAAHLKALE